MVKKEQKILSIILVLAIVIGVVALSGCTQTPTKTNKIIVGTDPTFKPFEYVDENGTIIGFDIDMVTAILTKLGYEVEIKDIGFDLLIGELQAGRIDVIAAGMTIDEERQQQISFSIPYYTSNQTVLVPLESKLIISNYTDFADLRLGAQIGTTGAKWVEEHLLNQTWLDEQNITKPLNITLERYPSYIEAVLDLEKNPPQIDAVIIDEPVGRTFTADGKTKIIYVIGTNESFGLGVKKENTALLQQINEELGTYMGSADWNALVSKYFG
jgi:polar amino acid transport system substrate-binding protein